MRGVGNLDDIVDRETSVCRLAIKPQLFPKCQVEFR